MFSIFAIHEGPRIRHIAKVIFAFSAFNAALNLKTTSLQMHHFLNICILQIHCF